MDDNQPEPIGEVSTALLDAELFVKYQAPERAIKRLRTALERSPRSIPLRERLREVAAAHKQLEEAARQCLALASLYIDREDFETAYDRLLEAKELDPRINIAAGLEAIRRSRQPDRKPAPPQVQNRAAVSSLVLAGDLSLISLFDAVQVIENSKLTGVLVLTAEVPSGKLFFNEGRIVDAECDGAKGAPGFRGIVEITSGTFDFQTSTRNFPINIQAASNTNLILDALRHFDEKAVEDREAETVNRKQ